MAKVSLASLLEGETPKEEKQEGMKSAGASGTKQTIPALLFKARTDAQLTHLKQPNRTLALHKALEMFYDDVVGLADTYIETTMGIYPDFSLDEVEESKVIDNPLQYFRGLYDAIEKNRTSVKETFLQNQIDEMQQLIAHTLYRLQFITT